MITGASSRRSSPAIRTAPIQRCESIFRSATNTEGAPSSAKSTASRPCADGKPTNKDERTAGRSHEGCRRFGPRRLFLEGGGVGLFEEERARGAGCRQL